MSELEALNRKRGIILRKLNTLHNNLELLELNTELSAQQSDALANFQEQLDSLLSEFETTQQGIDTHICDANRDKLLTKKFEILNIINECSEIIDRMSAQASDQDITISNLNINV